MKSPIDSRQLQIFLALAGKGSLKAAAAQLHLTSSAISHSITNLEAELGVQLFHRSGRGLCLTEHGERLHRRAGPVLAQLLGLRSLLGADGSETRPTLRVAAAPSFAASIAPDVIREFDECFTRGRVLLRAAPRTTCLRLLQDREVDCAIVADPPEESADHAYEKLFLDRLLILISARSPLARLEVAPLRQIVERPLIAAQPQGHTVRSALAQLRRRGFEFRDCIEVGSFAMVVEMVKLGQGVGLVPDWLPRRDPLSPLVTDRPLEGIQLTRLWALVTPRWSSPDLASRTFLRLCQHAGRNLSAGAAGSSPFSEPDQRLAS